MGKWKECLRWKSDDKPETTPAIVQVSKKGKVRILSYKHWNEQNQSYSVRKKRKVVQSTNRGKQRHEKYNEKKGKYHHVHIRGRAYPVHRLVAIAWVPNPDNKPQVNHIDGNRSNNHYKNLEWVTNKENMQHAHRMGLRNTVYEGNKKITDDLIVEMKKLASFGYTSIEIGKKLNLSHETVRTTINLKSSSKKLTRFVSKLTSGLTNQPNGFYIRRLHKTYKTLNEAIIAKTEFISNNGTKRDIELWKKTLHLSKKMIIKEN